MVVDLSHCDYLDSTFLGCLVSLHRKYNRTSPHRFQVAASCDQCQKLLAPTHLNHLLNVTEVCPEPVSDVLEVSRPLLPTHDLCRHIMECHRQLAELGGSQAASFRSIADHLARELGEAPGGGDPPTDQYEIPSPLRFTEGGSGRPSPERRPGRTRADRGDDRARQRPGVDLLRASGMTRTEPAEAKLDPPAKRRSIGPDQGEPQAGLQ